MFSSSDSVIELEKNIDAVIDSLVPCLNRCKQEYTDKDKENLFVLDKLGFNINDISEEMKQNLKKLFADNEVLNIDYYGKKHHITMNTLHIQESLIVDDEFVELELLTKKADAFFKEMEKMHSLLQRQLDIAEAHLENTEDKCNEKAAIEMSFKLKMEKKEHELNLLQRITENLEQPQFSWKEVEALQCEEKKLQEEVMFTEAMLAKYHNLPLDEKAASEQLLKLEKEVEKVDTEINLKLNDFN